MHGGLKLLPFTSYVCITAAVDGARHFALLSVVDEAGDVDEGHVQVKDVGAHVEPHRAEGTLGVDDGGLHSGHGRHPNDAALDALSIYCLRGLQLHCNVSLSWLRWLDHLRTWLSGR